MSIKNILKRSETILKETGSYFEAQPQRAAERELIAQFVAKVSDSSYKLDDEDRKNVVRLLRVAKSYHEYSTGGAGFMVPYYLKDDKYDAVLAAWLRDHKKNVEPMPIVPKGMEKVKIVDERLANNMDKAYRILADDPLMEGVAETDSIEKFMKRAIGERGKKYTLKVLLRPKLDGVSLALKLNGKGIVKKATSRGEGDEGLRIKGLEGIKLGDNDNDSLVQHELYVTNDNLAKLNKLRDTAYKSNRSAAAGILARLAQYEDEELCTELLECASFYPIDFIDDEKSMEKRFKKLKQFNTRNVADLGYIVEGDRKEVMAAITKYWKEISEKRAKLGYDVDGLVITILNEEIQEDMGRSKNKNKFQIALKFPPVSEKGRLKGIYLDCGNLGRRTHKALLETPVIIGGHTYTTAKFGKVSDLDREFHVGDECRFVRVGDAIPTIVFSADCEKGRGPVIIPPDTCPTCGTSLDLIDGVYKCENSRCPSNVAGLIVNFFEKIGMDGYGPEFAGLVTPFVSPDVDGLARMCTFDADFLISRGVGKKSAEKFQKRIQEALKKTKDYELLGALGLPGVSTANAAKILSAMTLDDLPNMEDYDIRLALEKVDGFGTASIAKFRRGLKGSKSGLLYFIDKINPERTDFKDAIIVATSDMSASEKTHIRDICGLNRNMVFTKNKKFNLLVVKDLKLDTEKAEAARKMEKKSETKVMYTVAEFEDKYGKK